VLSGFVEVDETYTHGSETNNHANKKNRTETGYVVVEKTSVVGALQRDGNVIAKVIPDRTRKSIIPFVEQNVKEMSLLMTDDFNVYDCLDDKYYHNTTTHSANHYVTGLVHTNSIEGFWSHLKRGIDGIYHWVSMTHLQSYVDEFSLRFNTRKHSTAERFDLILQNVAGRRLTYQTLINK
jgi:transposase-like protein